MGSLRRWVLGLGIAGTVVCGLLAAPSGALALAPLSFSTPSLIDKEPPPGDYTALTAISCPSSDFCVAGDNQGSALTSANPGAAGDASWSVEHADYHSQNDTVTGISCAGTSLCVEVDNNGDAAVTTDPADGGTAKWNIVVADTAQFAALNAISCPTASLCVGVDTGGNIVTSTNADAGASSTWITRNVDGGNTFTGISCPSASLCVAVDSAGNVFISKDPGDAATATWTNRSLPSGAPTAISCPSTTLCVATDSAGDVDTSTNPLQGSGSTWAQQNLDANPLTAVSCAPNTTTCVALDSTGQAFGSSDADAAASATWGASAAHAYKAISCATTSLCVGASSGSFSTTANPGAGTATTWAVKGVDGVGYPLGDASCVGTTLCATTDDRGDVLTTTDPLDRGAATWSADAVNPQVRAVSCGSTTLCVAIGGGDVFVTSDPLDGASARWTTLAVDGSNQLQSISCPTDTLCVAVDYSGNAVISTNPTGGAGAWSVQPIDSPNYLTNVDCTPSLCVATDTINAGATGQTGGDTISTTDPQDGASAKWTVTKIAPNGLGAVSCVTSGSSSLCEIVDQAKTLVSTDPGDAATATWTAGPFMSYVNDVACPSLTLCVATQYGPAAWVTTDPADGASATWTEQQIDMPQQVIGGSPSISAVACGDPSLCVAVDNQGRAIVGSGAAAPHMLNVAFGGTGSGTVAGGGISCSSPCSHSFPNGTQVTLTATPASGSTFTGWSGACSGTGTCSVTMTADQQVVANFALQSTPQRTLTVALAGGGSGTVSGSGISCPGTCSSSYPSGTVISLTATAAAGSEFTGWSGACTGTGPCTLTLTAAATVTATFVPVSDVTLTVTLGGAGSGTVSGDGISCPGTCSASYPPGTPVTLSAQPTNGSTFTGWSGACTGTGPCTVTVSHDASVTATFAAANSATLTGIVADGALAANPPLRGVSVFACGSVCAVTTTPADGRYTMAGIAPGTYNLQVTPAQRSLNPASATVNVPLGVTEQDFDLTAPLPLSGGVTFNQTGTQRHGVPKVFWGAPFTFSVPAPVPASAAPNSIVLVNVTGALTRDPGDGTNGGFGIAATELLTVVYGADGRPARLIGMLDDAGSAAAGAGAAGDLRAPRSAHAALAPRAVAAKGGGGRGGGNPFDGLDDIKDFLDHFNFSQDSNGDATLEYTKGNRYIAQHVTACKHHDAKSGQDSYCLFPSVTTVPIRACKVPKFAKGAQAKAADQAEKAENQMSKAEQNAINNALKAAGDQFQNAWNAFQQQYQNAQNAVNQSPLNPGSWMNNFNNYVSTYHASDVTGRSAAAGAGAAMSSTVLINGKPGPLLAAGKPYLPLNGSSRLVVQFTAPVMSTLGIHGDLEWSIDDGAAPITFSPGLPPQALTAAAAPPGGGCGDIYIDPSGRVMTRTGIPLAGARVRLLRGASRHAKLGRVPNGSTIMSATNRRNPDRTNALGQFGWDTLPGFYAVQASHSGCTPARTSVFGVPPPRANLVLRLRCRALHRTPTRLRLRVIGGTASAALVARVSSRHGGRPLGSVVFRVRGLGTRSAAVDPRTGYAVVVVGGLAGGRVHAAYSGDGRHLPSHASAR